MRGHVRCNPLFPLLAGPSIELIAKEVVVSPVQMVTFCEFIFPYNELCFKLNSGL